MAKWGEIKCREAASKCSRCEELEAKLAKAVEQLLGAAEQLDAYVGYGYGDEYREAVAKLTSSEAATKDGGKNDRRPERHAGQLQDL